MPDQPLAEINAPAVAEVSCNVQVWRKLETMLSTTCFNIKKLKRELFECCLYYNVTKLKQELFKRCLNFSVTELKQELFKRCLCIYITELKREPFFVLLGPGHIHCNLTYHAQLGFFL